MTDLKKTNKAPAYLSYEDYLDEVTTLISEIYTVADDVAIDMVVRAQADDFFSIHDDQPTLCTLEKAQEDARTVFKTYKLKRGKN